VVPPALANGITEDRVRLEALRASPPALTLRLARCHEYLREHAEVQTYSEGDEPDRHQAA
jgi:hypothetical protein